MRYPDRQKNTLTPTKPSMSGLVGACWQRTRRMATPRTPSNAGRMPRSRTSRPRMQACESVIALRVHPLDRPPRPVPRAMVLSLRVHGRQGGVVQEAREYRAGGEVRTRGEPATRTARCGWDLTVKAMTRPAVVSGYGRDES